MSDATAEQHDESQGLAGLRICFTGKIHEMPREELLALVEDLGGIPQTAVTKETDLLVIGEKVGQTKIKAAEKNGVRIMTAAEFLGLDGSDQ
jgi:DNA ligase (NAD+)